MKTNMLCGLLLTVSCSIGFVLSAHPCPGEAFLNPRTGRETYCSTPGYIGCPSVYFKCMLDPATSRGFCCPAKPCEGSFPEISTNTKGPKYCGFPNANHFETCSPGFYEDLHPTFYYATCCAEHPCRGKAEMVAGSRREKNCGIRYMRDVCSSGFECRFNPGRFAVCCPLVEKCPEVCKKECNKNKQNLNLPAPVVTEKPKKNKKKKPKRDSSNSSDSDGSDDSDDSNKKRRRNRSSSSDSSS